MTTVHKFEEAGLGIAPFRLTNIYEDRGPKTISQRGGVTLQVGSPGQPMGICDFCGTGIAECCEITDAKGKTFIVGNQCVKKTGDAGLVNKAKREINRIRRERGYVRDDARIASALELFATAAIRKVAESHPSPQEWRASQGDTLANHIDWMLKYSGRSGKVRMARLIEKIAKEIA